MPVKLTILIDGECSLCRKEAAFMRKLDRGRGRLAMIDISAPDFDPARYGRTFEQLMGEIHGVLPDGSVVTGVEVFRRAYAAVGWGWVLGWTAWPGLRWVSDHVYRWFAWGRLRLRGRKDCVSGRCGVPKP